MPFISIEEENWRAEERGEDKGEGQERRRVGRRRGEQSRSIALNID